VGHDSPIFLPSITEAIAFRTPHIATRNCTI
jgi:hypothetical protein